MKKKSFFALCVMAIMAMTFAVGSCKKQEAQNTPTNGDRTPIAMYDANGNIVSLKTVEEVQKKFNSMCVAKEADLFVLESYSIQSATDDEPYYIRFVIIDVKENCSYSMALIGDFVEENDQFFYLTQNVEDGNFSFRANQDQQVVVYDNGQPTVIVDPTPDMLPPAWFVQCHRGSNCVIESGSCSPVRVGPGDYTCSACNKINSGDPDTCTMQAIVYPGFWGMIMNLLRAL